jgi:crotonobetainyl-CoA:carnitine CoA-transferase CaiB-like acyl-CoA transferase
VAVDEGYLEQTGVDGTDLVREVCAILMQHEALAAVPALSTVEQLVAHYPYLSSELQKRLSPEKPAIQAVEPARIAPIPAEDNPTHT